MPRSKKQYPTIYAKDRNEWHDWLLTNHAVSSGVSLIYYKKGSKKPSVSYDEAVEEAHRKGCRAGRREQEALSLVNSIALFQQLQLSLKEDP